MKCDFPIEILSGYLDNELDEKQRAAAADHIESCPQCRQLVELFRANDRLLRKAEVEEPSREFTFSLNRRVLERVRQRVRVPIWRYLPVLAPVTVAAMIVVVFLSSRPGARYINSSDRIYLIEAKNYEAVDDVEYRRDKAGGLAKDEAKEKAPERTSTAPGSGVVAAKKAEGFYPAAPVEDEAAGEGRGMVAGAAAQLELPENQVVRAIVDSTGKVLKVATGNTIIPEPDTQLENRLEGQQLAPPTVRGKRLQLYVDLSTANADADTSADSTGSAVDTETE